MNHVCDKADGSYCCFRSFYTYSDILVHVYCGNAAKKRRQGLRKSRADI